jgi:NADPH-dependent 2,4-dienoyl-CoA reductase/sulfur reductase-like enzyme
MIEAAPQPLIGVLGADLGAWFATLHRAEGVQVLTGATVDGVQANGHIQGLHLSDGSHVAADHVLVGVGVGADVAWLAGSGLLTDGRLLVDDCGRTIAPGVFAAGDVAAAFDPQAGRHVPGSHWEAAARHGARAARAMLELDPGPMPIAGFWSDQYGIRIQYLGHAGDADRVTVDGDMTGRDFTATFHRAGRPVAVLLVNRPRQLPAARQLIQKGAP